MILPDYSRFSTLYECETMLALSPNDAFVLRWPEPARKWHKILYKRQPTIGFRSELFFLAIAMEIAKTQSKTYSIKDAWYKISYESSLEELVNTILGND